MAFQNSAAEIILWRMIAGIGIGVELVTIDTYIVELMPKEVRGRAFAVNEVVQFCAVPVVALIAWRLVPLRPWGFDGWRWVVLIGSVGAIFVWFIRQRIPESPRWLIARRQTGRGRTRDRRNRTARQQRKGSPLPAPENRINGGTTRKFS